MEIYDNNFSRFGLTIAIDKTQTLAFNVSEEVKSMKSLITLRNEPIDNVRSFKYLGHVLSNKLENSSAFINHQISSAYAKWNEMKSVFLDKRIFYPPEINFWKRVCVSRLLYSAHAWQLGAKDMWKVRK